MGKNDRKDVRGFFHAEHPFFCPRHLKKSVYSVFLKKSVSRQDFDFFRCKLAVFSERKSLVELQAAHRDAL